MSNYVIFTENYKYKGNLREVPKDETDTQARKDVERLLATGNFELNFDIELLNFCLYSTGCKMVHSLYISDGVIYLLKDSEKQYKIVDIDILLEIWPPRERVLDFLTGEYEICGPVANWQQFFVLRLDNKWRQDKIERDAARAAIKVYAEHMKDHKPQLYQKIQDWYGEIEATEVPDSFEVGVQEFLKINEFTEHLKLNRKVNQEDLKDVFNKIDEIINA